MKRGSTEYKYTPPMRLPQAPNPESILVPHNAPTISQVDQTLWFRAALVRATVLINDDLDARHRNDEAFQCSLM